MMGLKTAPLNAHRASLARSRSKSWLGGNDVVLQHTLELPLP